MSQLPEPRFLGSERRSVDDRGRSPVPSQFRKSLSEHGIQELYLSVTQACGFPVVRVYPPDAFTKVVQELNELEDPEDQDAAYAFMHLASRCEIDDAGRVQLPARFREYLQVTKEIVWTGLGQYFDLTHPEAGKILPAVLNQAATNRNSPISRIQRCVFRSEKAGGASGSMARPAADQ
ncbi:MAG: hypothetical protein RBU45_05380 [Myxococcota bacterium]|nr:hypothetical protein [Myxococcota bacterium]